MGDLMEVLQLLLILGSIALIIKAEDNITFSLPSHCTKKCGNISIEYPFGVENGCFYAIGFKLTCIEKYSSTQLLLEGRDTIEVLQINITTGLVYIKSPTITMDTKGEYMSTSLIDLENWPYSFNLLYKKKGDSSFSYTDNCIYTMGCSAVAYLMDSTNTTLQSCLTMCSPDLPNKNHYVMGNGYCYKYLYNINVTSLRIQLTRLNQKELHLINTSSIKVLIFDYGFTDYDSIQELILDENSKKVGASLAWYINDGYSTCEQANKSTTYACRSRNSNCYDAFYDTSFMNDSSSLGYICLCSLGYQGNPYLPGGCQEASFVRHSPDKGCEKTCGIVNIIFPFGLTISCSRDESFVLNCDKTFDPPILLFNPFQYTHPYTYIVTRISLEKGQLELLRRINASSGSSYCDRMKYSQFLEEKTTYNWVVAQQHCDDAEKNKAIYACVAKHSICQYNSSIDFPGYRCKCWEGYQGNPYLTNGCQDIDECKDREKYKCYGNCTNTPGNYTCTCEEGKHGDPTREGGCIPDKQNQTLILGIIIGGSNGVGLLLISASFFILRQKWKRIKHTKMREKHFHQNHGLLLQQLISSCEDSTERTKIFPLKEIEKATNHFDETRVVGRGGHGIVYKGILSDQRVVAIKKSKIVKKSEIDQFINEVVVLSQINHRNVVKLFGCCLESEVPLLIYEFISNGTLLDHLHNGNSILSWEDRLRIATEAAGALAYLHSATSMPIFHRDVKSSNILLDDHLTAKVSDFGASRFIPLDQTHLVTTIQGTFGYLDPEYYQTSQLTEKSDVYSFGVILLELLTGKKPIYSIEHEFQQNLSLHFLQTVRDNHSFELVEDCVMREAIKEELIEVIQLIEMCLELKGAKRPTMKEVEHKLQCLRRIRMKIRVNCIAVDNEETDPLLNGFSKSVDQIIESTFMSYSSEKELMPSTYNQQ